MRCEAAIRGLINNSALLHGPAREGRDEGVGVWGGQRQMSLCGE